MNNRKQEKMDKDYELLQYVIERAERQWEYKLKREIDVLKELTPEKLQKYPTDMITALRYTANLIARREKQN